MYKIIGADQKEYGPVPTETLQQWIREGRVNAQTLVRAEGVADWQPVSTLLEFSALFAVAPVSQPTLTTQRKTNGLAVTSLIMGLFSITLGQCCCYGLPFNLLGILFALIALSQIKHHPDSQTGRGLALAGLFLSIASILLAVALLIIGVAFNWNDIVRDLKKI